MKHKRIFLISVVYAYIFLIGFINVQLGLLSLTALCCGYMMKK